MSDILGRYRVQANPLRSERRVELLVLLLTLALLMQLAWGVFQLFLPSMPSAVRPADDAMRVVGLDARGSVAPEQRTEVRQRPVFWESRRPVEVESATEQVVEVDEPEDAKLGSLKSVKLTGVFGGGDSAGIIFLAKGKEHRIMVGDEVNGWTLESVDATHAHFSGNGREAELSLKRGTITVVQPPPAAKAPGSKQAGTKAGDDAAAAPAPMPGRGPATQQSDSLSLGGGGS